MSTAAAINVNQILTRVAVETGLDAVNDPFGSRKQEYIQLRALLQVAGEDLCLAYPWEFLLKSLEIVATASVSGEYDLPEDFLSMVDQTGYYDDETDIIGSLSSQEWEAVTKKGAIVTSDVYRLRGGKVCLHPSPKPPKTARFEYLSRFFVEEVAPVRLLKGNISKGSDIILFDRTLITRYLKVLWLESKGFDTSAAQNAFNQAFSFITSKDTAGKIISPVHGSAFRLLDARNINESGFGL